jgi:hypothetical protein
MARCPLVRPETVRHTFDDGEWVELAKELTAGEYREMVAVQFKDRVAGEKPVMDIRQFGISTILAYVKEWSFVDAQGNTLPITEDWLKKFDVPTFAELRKVAEDHHEQSEKAIDARKNAVAGAKTS